MNTPATTAPIAATWFWDTQTLHHNVIVTLRDGAIAAIADADGRHALDATHVDLLLPGLVNAHSHAFQRGFRGWVQRGDEEDDFFRWRESMYSLANRLTPGGVEALARLCFVEMAEAGITAVGEFHYLHHDIDGRPYDDPDELAHRVIQAATDVGIRITLLRCAYASGGIDQPPEHGQRRFLDRSPDDVLAAAQRLSALDEPLLTVGIAPHSVRAVPRDWLPELATFDGPVHAHVAEQQVEVDACLRRYGVSPLCVFADAGLLDQRFTAVHMTRPSPGDRALLMDAQASVCVCPSTELDLGDGFLPPELRRDVSLCVGTDSHAVIEPLAEGRALELHGRGQLRRRLAMVASADHNLLAETILRAVTCHGSRAIGHGDARLGVGSPADLVGVCLDRPAAAGLPPLCAAAFVAQPGWVTDVWVRAAHIVRNGTHALRASAMRDAQTWLGAF